MGLDGRLLNPPEEELEPAESPSGGIGLFPPWKPQLNNSVTTPPNQCATCRLPCGQPMNQPGWSGSQQFNAHALQSTNVNSTDATTQSTTTKHKGQVLSGALAVAPLPM